MLKIFKPDFCSWKPLNPANFPPSKRQKVSAEDGYLARFLPPPGLQKNTLTTVNGDQVFLAPQPRMATVSPEQQHLNMTSDVHDGRVNLLPPPVQHNRNLTIEQQIFANQNNLDYLAHLQAQNQNAMREEFVIVAFFFGALI